MLLDTTSSWVLEHIGTHKVFHLRKGENRIGRKPNCHIYLGYDFISRLHAILYVEEDVKLRCWKTRNSVLVNQREENGLLSLKAGDEISFGVRMYKEPARERDTVFILKNSQTKETKCTSLNFNDIIEISDDEEEEIRVPDITSVQSNQAYESNTFNINGTTVNNALISKNKSEGIEQPNVVLNSNAEVIFNGTKIKQEPETDNDNIKNEHVDAYDKNFSEDDRSTIMLRTSMDYSRLASKSSSENLANVKLSGDVEGVKSVVSKDISIITPVENNQTVCNTILENSGNHKEVVVQLEQQLSPTTKTCSEDSLDHRPCTSQQAALRLRLKSKRDTFNEPVIIENIQISKPSQDSSQTINSTNLTADPQQKSIEQTTTCITTHSLNESDRVFKEPQIGNHPSAVQTANITLGTESEITSTITNQNVLNASKIWSYVQTNTPFASYQTATDTNRCLSLVPYGNNNKLNNNETTSVQENLSQKIVLYKSSSTQNIVHINYSNIEKKNRCQQLIPYVKVNKNNCTDLVPFVNKNNCTDLVPFVSGIKLANGVKPPQEGISLITLQKIKIIEFKPKPELSKPRKTSKKPAKRKCEDKTQAKCKYVGTPPRKKRKQSQDHPGSSKNKTKFETKTKMNGTAESTVIDLNITINIQSCEK